MNRYTGILLAALCWTACGKKYSDPIGNRFLSAQITASPLTIAPDSLVTITGQGFSTSPDQDLVYFNGTGAAVLQASTTRLVVKAPATGTTGNITVRVNGEQANGPVFSYLTGSAFAMSPLSGIDSTTVTLTTGVRVGPAATTTVQFGNLPGKVLFTDSGRIIVAAPTGVQTSQLQIRTNGQQYPGPVFTRITVQAISPNIQGAGSGTIQITGTGFNPVLNQNSVSFAQNGTGNRVPATIVRGTADTLIVQIPATAGTGPVTVNPNNQNTVTGPVFTLFGFSTADGGPYAFPYIFTSGVLQLLTGHGFNPDITQNHLTVNGLPCTISYVSPTGDSILYYPPDLINPPNIGQANGPMVLQSGNLTATASVGYRTNDYFEVSTLAGGSFGLANGRGRSAQFETLSGITYGRPNGGFSGPAYLYVTDRQANNIRQISTDGVVTLVAGSPTGQAGFADGIGASALFNAPSGIAIDFAGNLWVADSGNFRVRMINLSTYQVTTIAGTGTQGSSDGSSSTAQFQGPSGIYVTYSPCCSILNNVIVTDAAGGTGSLRQVVRNSDLSVGVTTLQSGLTNPRSPAYFNGLLSYSDNQAVYLYQNGASTLIGGTPGTAGFSNGSTGTLFNDIQGLSAGYGKAAGIYYFVSDAANNQIRLVYDKTNGSGQGSPYPVYSYVGGAGSTTAGYQDGGYRTALFNRPGPLVFVGGSNRNYLYVCDVGNHAIRIFN